jgi:hypothetical protein
MWLHCSKLCYIPAPFLAVVNFMNRLFIPVRFHLSIYHADWIIGELFWPCKWRRYVIPKHQLAFSGLHPIIFRQLVLPLRTSFSYFSLPDLYLHLPLGLSSLARSAVKHETSFRIMCTFCTWALYRLLQNLLFGRPGILLRISPHYEGCLKIITSLSNW